ncbi:MAG TPA: hypothetical protein VIV11_38980 [Kofleriaceae bacterium]
MSFVDLELAVVDAALCYAMVAFAVITGAASRRRRRRAVARLGAIGSSRQPS